MSASTAIDPSLAQAASDIQQKVKELEALGEDDLKGAMDDLKKALMQNPAACSLMLPEDVGSMVTALRRITGQALVTAKKTKAPKIPKLSQMTAEQIAELEDF